MKVLVTGANGFIGKNLCSELNNQNIKVIKFTRECDLNDLKSYTKKCDFVFHLAGANRPERESDFNDINFGLTRELFDALKQSENKCPIIITSSTQSGLENPYGVSKKQAEELALDNQNNKVFIYRLPNVFGKWSKPNYNTVIATFCHNISRDLPIQVNNRDAELNLVYIDDLVKDFISLMNNASSEEGGYKQVSKSYNVTLGQIADSINFFKETRANLTVPNMFDEFTKKLYSTYLSFLPEDNFSYPLKMNVDNRGSFTEFLRLDGKGQVSVNISKAGITKGNHWHHTKNEKFLVVSGSGVVRFRNILTDDVIEYFVSSDKLEVVDIPVGYTHNIENLGSADMVTIMWANEYFDKDNPDTYFLKV